MAKTARPRKPQMRAGLRYGRAQPINYGVLPTLLGYQLRRAQMRVFQHFSDHVNNFLADRYGVSGMGPEWTMTPGQAGLLVLIAYNPGISQTALARAAGIERSTLGEVVDRFVQRDLVERRPSLRDRRSYALHLSGEGLKLLDDFIPQIRAHEALVAGNLSLEERAQLVALLDKLATER